MKYIQKDYEDIRDAVKSAYNTNQSVMEKLFWADEQIMNTEERLAKSIATLEELKTKMNVHINTLASFMGKNEVYPTDSVNDIAEKVV